MKLVRNHKEGNLPEGATQAPVSIFRQAADTIYQTLGNPQNPNGLCSGIPSNANAPNDIAPPSR